MKPVLRSEILPLGEYESVRDQFRARVIEEKKARRVHLGDRVTCTFENHDTVLMQIQEMLRTERITKESSILHEMETYNALVPNDHELSATVMIEINDNAERDKFLAAARGFEDHIAIVIDGDLFPASHEKPLAPAERTTAVHYFKFRITDAAKKKLISRSAKVWLESSHAVYKERVNLSAALLASLADDFA